MNQCNVLTKFIYGLLIVVLGTLSGCETSTTSHSGLSLFSPSATLPAESPKKVALLLPLEGKLATEGQAIQKGFMAAHSNLANATRPDIKTYETNHYPAPQTAYQEAIAQGADFVVGPLDKQSVQSLSQAGNISSPVLALNYLDNHQKTASLFYQFGLSPQDEAHQAADRIWRDGHRSIILITPLGSWGRGIATSFQQRWQANGGTIVDRLAYTPQPERLGSQIASVLQFKENKVAPEASEDGAWRPSRKVITQRRQDVDAIFLVANPTVARQIRPLLKFYDAGQIPVYATSQIYSGTPNPNADRDINGIMFCDIPWVFNNPPVMANIRNQLAAQQAGNFQQHLRLYALGVDAYQLATQLNRLASTPGSSITGATGTLYLDNQQRILRQLQWAQFQNGVPVVLPN